MLNTILGLLIAVAALASGCGKAPDLSTSNITTPKAADVTQNFTYGHFTELCDAVKNWDSSKTNIHFDADAAGSTTYDFTAVKLTQTYNNVASVLGEAFVGVGPYPFTCKINISGGKIASVQ